MRWRMKSGPSPRGAGFGSLPSKHFVSKGPEKHAQKYFQCFGTGKKLRVWPHTTRDQRLCLRNDFVADRFPELRLHLVNSSAPVQLLLLELSH